MAISLDNFGEMLQGDINLKVDFIHRII